MPDREKYRQKALDCTAAAENMRDPQERASMLAIAKLFMKLADRVGLRHDRATAHRPTGDLPVEKDS
ncbi:MAG TPA: hypothetical protein VKW08_11130 [Xanthobacteraceae bacterium]|nr:hypothetical protein [Xanthobacteraceae bacterium]